MRNIRKAPSNEPSKSTMPESATLNSIKNNRMSGSENRMPFKARFRCGNRMKSAGATFECYNFSTGHNFFFFFYDEPQL